MHCGSGHLPQTLGCAAVLFGLAAMQLHVIDRPYQWAFAIVWLSISGVLVFYSLQVAGRATVLGLALLLAVATLVFLATLSYLFRSFAFRILLPLSGLLLVAYSLLMIWLTDSDSPWLIRCIALFLAAFGAASIAVGVREPLH
jgi:hypothetical protein